MIVVAITMVIFIPCALVFIPLKAMYNRKVSKYISIILLIVLIAISWVFAALYAFNVTQYDANMWAIRYGCAFAVDFFIVCPLVVGISFFIYKKLRIPEREAKNSSARFWALVLFEPIFSTNL